MSVAERPGLRRDGRVRRLLAAPGVEDALVLAACLGFAVLVGRRVLQAGVFEGDAFVHQYWMWHWRDAALFNDPLTHELRESSRYPLGYQGLFWLGTHVTSPIVFGEWLGVGLMAVSGWLVFRIVRAHATWAPAAWLGAALFLSVWDIHRFSGGFSRAFVQPVVLLTVLLLLRGRPLPAALVAGASALLYPPAAVLAVGIVVLCGLVALVRTRAVGRREVVAAGVAIVVGLACVLGPQLVLGPAPAVLTGAQARAFAEFGPGGTLHVFVSSPLRYLSQNRTGFDLRVSGGLLALAALVVLLARPANLRLLRAPVWAMPVVALAGWGIAQLVLFRLYLPHRYTYPLVAFFAIAIAVALMPTWTALWARLRPRAPDSRPAIAALLTGIALVAVLIVVPERSPGGWRCTDGATTRAIAGLPKDAIIAGDPIDLNCLPATARRAVVISTQLAPSYERAYFLQGRARMFASLRALYAPTIQPLLALRSRYGATDLWIKRDAIVAQTEGRGRWNSRAQPYRGFVTRVAAGGRPAVLDLPPDCRRFRRGGNELYDLDCVARSARASM